MSRTRGALYQDTPHGPALLWYGASNVNWTTPASVTYTRNAAGDYSLNIGASVGPIYITGALADLKRQTFNVDYLLGSPNPSGLPFQEAFGTAAGGPGYPDTVAGIPPYAGTSMLTPATTQPAKGLRVYGLQIVYLIGGAALTTHTINLYRTVYANNTANAITTVTLSSNSLSTAIQTNPYVTSVTVSTPVFEVTAMSDLIAEIAVTTAASGSYRFYGVGFLCDFNFS